MGTYTHSEPNKQFYKNRKSSKMSSTMDKTKAKAKEVAIEDFNKAKALAQSAAKSGAYLYPIKGIFYFLSHRSLWKPLLSKLVPTLSLSVVLVSRRQTGVLSEGRQLKAGNFNDPMEKLGKLIKSPFEKFTPKAFIRYIMYLPLNFIPVVGTVIFVALQGRSRGNSVHTRYFQLKKWSNPQKEAWLKENTAPYTAFGTVATLLELIPFASIFFTFTNTVGAALWAADIEGNNTAMTEMTSPKPREGTKKVEYAHLQPPEIGVDRAITARSQYCRRVASRASYHGFECMQPHRRVLFLLLNLFFLSISVCREEES